MFSNVSLMFSPAAENTGVATQGRGLRAHRDSVGVDRIAQGYDQCYVRMSTSPSSPVVSSAHYTASLSLS